MQPFSKDILIVDFEPTNGDAYSAEPIQVGAILLDKDSLAEKKRFISYIKADLSNANPKTLAVSGITEDDLKNAPIAAEVGKAFVETFGTDVMLSSWVQNLDRAMLRKLLLAAGFEDRIYDYHYLDLWPIAYLYLLKRGYVGSIRSEEMFREFKLPPRDHHDALEDCKMAAIVLRQIAEAD